MFTWIHLVSPLLISLFVLNSKGEQCQQEGGQCYPLTQFCTVTLVDRNNNFCPSSQQCCLEKPPAGNNQCEQMYKGRCVPSMSECSMIGEGFNGNPICGVNEICCISGSGGNPPTTAPETVRPQPDEDPECGVPEVSSGGWRIVHGEPSSHGRWPWQVSQRRYGRHVCGGSIINRQYILTAAHCVYGSHPSQITIVTGDTRQTVRHGTEREYRVSRIIWHREYSSRDTAGPHDIALIKLATPIQYDAYTKPVCLNGIRGQFDYNRNCYITGWGDTRQTGDNSHLQQLQGYPIDNYRCSQKWGFQLKDQHICFGEGGNGACNGDSGGPFTCEKDGRYYVIGVASFATDDCSKYSGVPSVYTRVSSYIDWIQENMEL